MGNAICLSLILMAAIVSGGCGGRAEPAASGPSPGRSEGAEVAREKEAIEALKLLGANVALDEQGRAKVLRLTGRKITDDQLEYVARLTELRALYLDGSNVTEAGLAQLEPLGKLERLHCVDVRRSGLRATLALALPTQVEFVDCPLLDVVEYFEDLHEISVEIDEQALKAANCSTVAPVTIKHHDLSLREVLAEILEPLELVWTLDGGVLVVTTEEALAEKWPHLTKLRETVPTLTDVRVDFEAAAEGAGQP